MDETSEKKTEGVENAPKPTSNKKITLHFKRAIDVCINGIKYPGPDVSLDDLKTASEIVRLAKQAYGNDVLA